MKLTDSFLDYLRYERNYSPETVKAYGSDLLQFEAYLLEEKGADVSLADADACSVRTWLASLMDAGCATTSINRKLSTLRSFYRFLLKQGVCRVDPLRKIAGPKNSKKLPAFVREKDMDRLLDDLGFENDFKGCRDRVIIETFYLTGMRLSELIGLKDVDVDFSALQFKVTGKRNKERLVPFGGELVEDLQEYVRRRNRIVTGCPKAFFVRESGEQLSRSIVEYIVKRNLSRVVSMERRSPHVLRHTFATQMLNHHAQLGSIKELLGHESLATTEIYTHVTFEDLKQMYNQAHPRA